VQFQFLREVDNKMIFVGEKAAYERILEGCKELKKYGVRAVTGACGFFGHYQKRLAAKLDIPVALSSLVQLPWIAAMLKPDEKIAVLTANEESCAPDLLRACSVPDEVIERCVIRGLGKEPQFKVILDDSCEFDNAQIKQELLGKAEEIVCEYPETGAFAAYHIGSGFASGQEVLQFFGAWGGAWAFITPLIPMVFIFIYAVGMFRSGMLQSFENPSDAYAWYCGKWVSKFMDIFSIIMIAGIGLEKVTDVLGAVIYAGSPHIYF